MQSNYPLEFLSLNYSSHIIIGQDHYWLTSICHIYSRHAVTLVVQRPIIVLPNLSPVKRLLFFLHAGMDLHELLDIPQGDRRKYHDDVTVMVISLEGGRIWKSSGKYL